MAQIKNDDWLLIDISGITKSNNNFWDGVTHSNIYTFYKHKKLQDYEKFFGRLIVQFHKNNVFVTLNGNRVDDFVLKEVLSNSLDNDLFTGYDKVNISWGELKRATEKDTWKTVLQNQKGVYFSRIYLMVKICWFSIRREYDFRTLHCLCKTGHVGSIGLKH